jgi:multiple sugar transport system ATP-binding protein
VARVVLDAVTKRFDNVAALEGVSLEAEDGRLTVVVGPSGCGKSTLLRIVAGLEGVDDGDVRIGGRDVTGAPPAERGVAMVFQSFALYPHMTGFDNMAFGLRERGMGKQEIRRRIEEAARKLHIEGLLGRRPGELSGGQKQRIAMGRALVRDPDVFLFDEPLSNLDAALRVEMRFEVARLQESLGATMLYVTHDQVEAMTLAHRLVVMRDGRVEQVGTPLGIYHEPANTFVAGFVGQPAMNLLPGTVAAVEQGAVRVDLENSCAVRVPALGQNLREGAPITVGVRPEHVRPSDSGLLAGKTLLVEELGAEMLVYLEMGGDRKLVLRLGGAGRPARGERLSVEIDEARCLLFGEDGTRLPRPR